MQLLLIVLFLFLFYPNTVGFRVLYNGQVIGNESYFKPYDKVLYYNTHHSLTYTINCTYFYLFIHLFIHVRALYLLFHHHKGFVGIFGDPTNFQRERVNEGAKETPTQELLYEGSSPRQSCPGMVGPFSDGNYYCTAREYGYCDKRSGICFCNMGYGGIDCAECIGSHFRLGSLCYPKKLCVDNCNGAGECNFYNGTCSCLPHRIGDYCEKKLCTYHDPLCDACTELDCLKCAPGYYITGNSSRVCSSCYDFDPRCAGCTKDLGCTLCADPILTSVRRSGYRSKDPQLPFEEDTRELSITLPFGTKSPDHFAEAEHYEVTDDTSNYLKNDARQCIQGSNNDSTWDCSNIAATHKVCGHKGVFKFTYPKFEVSEQDSFILLTVERSGGGYGDVFINYFIKHFNSNDSDCSPTAPYTTVQRLSFESGVISRSFLIGILDDNIVEDDEVFQVILETPEGGGSLGPQFRTNVTIKDDDLYKLSPKKSYPITRTISTTANVSFTGTIQAVLATDDVMTMGGEKFYALVENSMNKWVDTGMKNNAQRHANANFAAVSDNGDGTYEVSGVMKEQGTYELRVWHAFPNGLKGQYYYDSFFTNLALERIDRKVNFTWGAGKLIPRGTDYISIRWSGAVYVEDSADYEFFVYADDHSRLWIDGSLCLDHFHELETVLEPKRTVYLQGNRLHEIILEYRELRGDAYAQLLWKKSTDSGDPEVIPPTILYSLHEIGSSPIIVSVASAETDASMTECTGGGLYKGKVQEKSYFEVCPRDSFLNYRDDDDEIYLRSQIFVGILSQSSDDGYGGVGSENITANLLYNNVSHCFDGSYTPQRAGTYLLTIKFKSSADASGTNVLGSPFTVTVSPTNGYGPLSVVSGLSEPLYAVAGSCYDFLIIVRDSFQNYQKTGGDDITVYSYRVTYNEEYSDPSADVTVSPTFSPTKSPTFRPSTSTPTVKPTTSIPTRTPSKNPTVKPSTSTPTTTPTRSPTQTPSMPTITKYPTAVPTRIPTRMPTSIPTKIPTVTPSVIPTMTPSVTPTKIPTKYPTVTPTVTPTANPSTRVPTKIPTIVPTTYAPSFSLTPSRMPVSVSPSTIWPTDVQPAGNPTALPSNPSRSPTTFIPTLIPSKVPTIKPSNTPTRRPSNPTYAPTKVPTFIPSTASPTNRPTYFPSFKPSSRPSNPTYKPSNSPKPSTASPSFRPTRMPTLKPTYTITESPNLGKVSFISSPMPPEDTSYVDIVRQNYVYDFGNGTYKVHVCPVIAGWHEIHMLLKAKGISNQPERILDTLISRGQNSGKDSYTGQYIADSPYLMIVSNNEAAAFSSTAAGAGLYNATVGITASLLLTVRDAYDNVYLSQSSYTCAISAVLLNNPDDYFHVWNYKNGSYLLYYVPSVAGSNVLSIYVNGGEIKGSPYEVNILDGEASSSYSYARGDSLTNTIAGNVHYFEVVPYDLYNNRKNIYNDSVYTYEITGVNTLSGVLEPCDYPRNPEQFECNLSDPNVALYYAKFTPLYIGTSTIRVYLSTSTTKVEISNSPFTLTTVPGVAIAINSIVRGSIYDNIAGEVGYVTVQMVDIGYNNLISGDHITELVLYGVAVEWGTIQPWGTTPGLQDEYHYKGFYSGYPNVYGTWIDNYDGSYVVRYNAEKAGEYVMRVSVAEPGLNATFYNTTDFGFLTDGSSNPAGYQASLQGRAYNTRTSISWTGDIGRRPNVDGSIGEGSYYDRFKSMSIPMINFNNTLDVLSPTDPDEYEYKFREDYWSARFHGLIIPEYAEKYNFTVITDPASRVKVYIGGRGTMLNDTESGLLLLDSSSSISTGVYNFTDTKYREFIFEYVHYTGQSSIQLFWESPSTPKSIVPASAFMHWSNITHYNTTIHPNDLAPSNSTAFGNGLTTAVVGVLQSFVVYARDENGNLLQEGGDTPTAYAIGRDGVEFRGNVTDYGNSTYYIEYYPQVSGTYLLYVTIGCCAAHPNVGYQSEVALNTAINIGSSPFILTVEPGPVFSSRSIATGEGILGSNTGERQSFDVHFRDIHSNPTTINAQYDAVTISVIFHDKARNSYLNVVNTIDDVEIHGASATIYYNITTAGSYDMYVSMAINGTNTASALNSSDISSVNQTIPIDYTVAANRNIRSIDETMVSPIAGSPFHIIVAPSKASSYHTRARGLGLRQAVVNKKYTFEVDIYDSYANLLITGGTRLYTRLVGDRSHNTDETVVPSCVDFQNGRISCSYIPLYSGMHQLVVRIVNQTNNMAGGQGLMGKYYSDTQQLAANLVYSRIDPKISFSWPDGLITNKSYLSLGQSIRWDGYVLAPRTDLFYFRIHSRNVNTTVYIDEMLVFDSFVGITNEVNLIANSVYAIHIEAVISPRYYSSTTPSAFDSVNVNNQEVELELVWATPTINWGIVSSFFLYDSAEDLLLSPYPVQVDDF